MAYDVIRLPDGQPAIVLDGEPSWCHALEAAPAGREPELDAGTWLVAVVAVWSIPDLVAIQTALDVVGRLEGSVQLGLRPYEDPQEHRAWCAGLEDERGSPLWLVLRDGDVIMKRGGLVEVGALVGAIDEALRGP